MSGRSCGVARASRHLLPCSPVTGPSPSGGARFAAQSVGPPLRQSSWRRRGMPRVRVVRSSTSSVRRLLARSSTTPPRSAGVPSSIAHVSRETRDDGSRSATGAGGEMPAPGYAAPHKGVGPQTVSHLGAGQREDVRARTLVSAQRGGQNAGDRTSHRVPDATRAGVADPGAPSSLRASNTWPGRHSQTQSAGYTQPDRPSQTRSPMPFRARVTTPPVRSAGHHATGLAAWCCRVANAPHRGYQVWHMHHVSRETPHCPAEGHLKARRLPLGL